MDSICVKEGWLLKWTNYWRRYKKRYVKIVREQLHIYKRDKSGVDIVLKSRFDICDLLIHSGAGPSFVVSDGLKTVLFKAQSVDEKEGWLSALRITKAKAISRHEADDSEMAFKNAEISEMLEELSAKQHEMKVIESNLVAERTVLEEFYSTSLKSSSQSTLTNFFNCAEKIMTLTSKSLSLNHDYLSLAERFSTSFKSFIKLEESQVEKLELVVEELGMDQIMLEETLRGSLKTGVTFMPNLYFYMVNSKKLHVNNQRPSMMKFSLMPPTPSSSSQKLSLSCKMSTGIPVLYEVTSFLFGLKRHKIPCSKKQRRKIIPDRLNQNSNWWEVLKNNIGKDLTKISLPVNFVEPLSMLQKLTEDLEYSSCLDKACSCDDPWERFAWVAAFAVSGYSTTLTRIYKPFNPILGETFECDRTDEMGWRSITEQVSHHPPIVAMHAQSKKWTFWQEQSATCKFRGKYFQVIPKGIVHLVLKGYGNVYTWNKVSTTVHNIIMGQPWIENHGEMEMIDHSTGVKCLMKYIPTSMFSRETGRKVTGMVYDKDGNPKYVISGTWSEQIEGAAVISQKGSDVDKLVFQTAPPKILWKCTQPPEYLSKCYNFTEFAVTLNEPEEDVAPTDSRRRPDQRLMEEGKWEEANKIKAELEMIQRAARKELELQVEADPNFVGYLPKWFRQENNTTIDRLTHIYTGEYWECKAANDWSRCPDIFSLTKINKNEQN